jgi:hypothetical protein
VSKSNSHPASEIGHLIVLDTDVLRQRWSELYGTAPAPRISRDMLIRGVAYRIQEEAHGGLDKSCRRLLQRMAEALRDSGSIPVSQSQPFKLGTKLIREWKGKVHEVVIAGDGYVWAGKRYRSLSQIARSITGTRWSGPRFFGLETEKQAATTLATLNPSTKVRTTAQGPTGATDG